MRRALAPYPGTGTRQLSLGFQTQPPARGDLHIDPGLVVCNVHLSAAFDDTATAFWRLRPTPARSDDDAVEACVGEPPPPPCTPPQPSVVSPLSPLSSLLLGRSPGECRRSGRGGVPGGLRCVRHGVPRPRCRSRPGQVPRRGRTDGNLRAVPHCPGAPEPPSRHTAGGSHTFLCFKLFEQHHNPRPGASKPVDHVLRAPAALCRLPRRGCRPYAARRRPTAHAPALRPRPGATGASAHPVAHAPHSAAPCQLPPQAWVLQELNRL